MAAVVETAGICQHCGHKALLGNGLCVDCWDGDGDEASLTPLTEPKPHVKALPIRVRYGNARSPYISEIVRLFALGYYQAEVAREVGLSRQRVHQIVCSLSLVGSFNGRRGSAKRLHQPTAIALSLPAVDYYTLFKERARQTIPPWVHNATL